MNVFAATPTVIPGIYRAIPGIQGPKDMVLARDERLLISIRRASRELQPIATIRSSRIRE